MPPQLGQKPALGKGTQLEHERDQAGGQPGKATLVGNTLDQDPPHTPGVRPPTPPEFAALDPVVVNKLWESRGELRFFKGKPEEKFWEHVRAIGPADLHTIVVVSKAAIAANLWPHMRILNGCYTNGSSYGLEFVGGNPVSVTASGWGKDFPQLVVQNEHGGTKHEWYRQDTGPGMPGLHLGINVGAGYDNVHIDPTNPMKAVGDGKLHMVPAPPGSRLPFVPVLVPKGQAIYDAGALVGHAAEIGFFGDGVKAKFKTTQSPTEKYLRMGVLADGNKIATEITDLEAGKVSRMRDQIRWDGLLGVLRAETGKIKSAHTLSLGLAMEDDTASAPALDAALTSAEIAAKNLWSALATLVRNLKAEAPGHSGDLQGFDHAEAWGPYAVAQGKPVVEALQATRQASTQ